MKWWDLGSQFYRETDHISRHPDETIVQELGEDVGKMPKWGPELLAECLGGT